MPCKKEAAAIENSWSWVPGKSVGPFRFGDDAGEVVQQHKLIRLETDYPEADWDTYEVPNCESRVMIEEGKVTDVLCCDRLDYRGIDILGLTLNEVRQLLGHEDQLEENVGLGQAAYFYQLGLTLFLADGVVRSAVCEAPVTEE